MKHRAGRCLYLSLTLLAYTSSACRQVATGSSTAEAAARADANAGADGGQTAYNGDQLFQSYQTLLGAVDSATATEVSKAVGAMSLAAYADTLSAPQQPVRFTIDGHAYQLTAGDVATLKAHLLSLQSRYSSLGALWHELGIDPLTITSADFHRGLEAAAGLEPAATQLMLVGSSPLGGLDVSRIADHMSNVVKITAGIGATLTLARGMSGKIPLTFTDRTVRSLKAQALIIQAQTELINAKIELKTATLALAAMTDGDFLPTAASPTAAAQDDHPDSPDSEAAADKSVDAAPHAGGATDAHGR